MRTDPKEVNVPRPIHQVSVLAAAVCAALVFSGSALAAPTTPVITSPSGPSVVGTPVTVEWSKSTFDAGAFPWYRLMVYDVTPSRPVTIEQPFDLFGTSKTLSVATGHEYLACVRAIQVLDGLQETSALSCRAFTVHEEPVLRQYGWREIALPPDPCLLCPIWALYLGDPDWEAQEVVGSSTSPTGHRNATVVGVSVDPRGLATPIFER